MQFSLKHSYIEIYMFVTMLYVSVTLPLLQELIFKNVCRRQFGLDLEQCRLNETINSQVQELMAKTLSFKNLIELTLGTLSPILISVLLTRSKTKNVLAIQIVCHAVVAVCMLVYDASDRLSALTMVCLFGFFVSLGNISGFVVICFDYISYKSDQRQRLFRFSASFFSLNAGFISQFFHGILVTKIGFSYTLIVYIAVVGLATFVFFTLEDYEDSSMVYRAIEIEEEEYAEQTSYLQTLRQFYYHVLSFPVHVRGAVLFLFAGNSLLALSIFGSIQVNVLYLLSKSIRADVKMVGYYTAASGAISSLSVLLILPVIKNFTKIPSWVVAALAETAMLCHIIMFGSARSTALIFYILPLLVFSYFTESVVATKVSVFLQTQTRAIYFGINGAFFNLFGCAGGYGVLKIYSISVHSYPSIVFYIIGSVRFVGAFMLICFLFILRGGGWNHGDSPQNDSPQPVPVS